MPDGIEQTTEGQDRIAFVGETPWHRKGQKLDPRASFMEMRRAAYMDYYVHRIPVWVTLPATEEDGEQKVARVPDHMALVRSGDHKILDVVSEEWYPVQTDEMFSFLEILRDEGIVMPETAGTFDDGRKVWVQASYGEPYTINGDLIMRYLMFGNGFLDRYAFSAWDTDLRTVCMNTYRWSVMLRDEREKDGMQKVFRHYHNRKEVLWESLIDTLEGLRIAHDMQQETLLAMAEIGCDQNDFDWMQLRTYDPAINNDQDLRAASRMGRNVQEYISSERWKKHIDGRRRDKLNELFYGGTGNYGVSMYDAINAFTEYVDWGSTDRLELADSRFASSVAGSGKNTKSKAFSVVADLTTHRS